MARVIAILLIGLVVALAGAHGARADWRDQIKVLRIGAVVGDNPVYRLQRLEPFRRRIEIEAGVPVEIVPAADFNMMIDAHASGRIDYAIYSATAYAAAMALCDCIEPLAAPRAVDGALGYYAIVVVRSDSLAKTLDQLKGQSLVLARPGSTAGHLVPMSEFSTDGIEPDAFFSRIRHADGPKEAIRTVLTGLADAGIAWSSMQGEGASGFDRGTLHDLIAAKEMKMDDVRVVWQSRRITHGPHAVSRRLPQSLKDRLRSALIRMKDLDAKAYDAVETIYGGGFAEIDAADYEALTDVFSPDAEESGKDGAEAGEPQQPAKAAN